MKGSFLFIITDSGGRQHKWLVDLKTGSGHVQKGDNGEWVSDGWRKGSEGSDGGREGGRQGREGGE